MGVTRRRLIAATLSTPVVLRGRIAAADTITIRIGALKLIHSITPYFYEQFLPAGYRVEIIPFESPTDGKSAVVTKSVDFGTFGIAAAILGAAAHEPVVVFGSECNKGMAVVARKDSSDRLAEGPEGQARGHLARIDPGGVHPGAPAHGRHVHQGRRVRCACRSARCRQRWRAAMSMPMSARNQGLDCRWRLASARSSSIRIPPRWAA